MSRTLSTLAAAVSTLMAMIVTLGLITAVNSAQAKPSEAYFVKVDRDTTTEAKPAAPVRSTRIKRAGGTVCCSIPRTGKLALVKPSDCRNVKGKIVKKTKCARVKRVSARKFANIVLKRGMTSSSKPATPGSLTTGGQKGWHCSGGGYYPCFCSGAGACNQFIAACVEVGGDLNCNEHNSEGQPTGCVCSK